MERKIGEIFEYNGEWYQCIKDTNISCINCCFYNDEGHKLCDEDVGACAKEYRSDAKSLCFKKLEKVGKPFEYKGKLFQTYKRATNEVIPKWDYDLTMFPSDNGTVAIEIKQNKEDMGEKDIIRVKQTPLQKLVNRYNNGLRYEDFEEEVKKLYTNNPTEENKLCPKPFNLEAAKSGKPVCTRDGEKARIICFDSTLENYPLVVLIEGDTGEYPYVYTTEGKFNKVEGESVFDLMMLPEKKEGWVNLYKSSVRSTKEEAMKYRNKCDDYIDTIKIEWEE